MPPAFENFSDVVTALLAAAASIERGDITPEEAGAISKALEKNRRAYETRLPEFQIAHLELWRRPKVEAATGLKRSAIYAAIGDGRFPKPVRLGENSVAWLASEVRDWIKQRIAERDESTA